jgi:hypothetical protein
MCWFSLANALRITRQCYSPAQMLARIFLVVETAAILASMFHVSGAGNYYWRSLLVELATIIGECFLGVVFCENWTCSKNKKMAFYISGCLCCMCSTQVGSSPLCNGTTWLLVAEP